ncbi:MAG: hypothetical protein K9N51_13180, partial [Candidatus Pacebacteria bacterium]|nr:hypothetical protein [Candidatus Paceibacterota bacterium]
MVRSRPHILIVGANPAWQVTLHFETLCFGEVNRAYSVAGVTGGKGVNAATALKQLGTDCTVLQFAGGDTGERVCSDLHAREIAHQTVTTHSTTRTCTTLLSDDSGEMTELIEPSNSVNQEEEDAFQQYFRELVQDIDGVAICGTHPPGVHDDFYSSLIYTAKDRAFIVLDTYKNAKAAFAAGAHMLKIN